MCRNVFSLHVSDSRFAAVPISLTWVDRQQGCSQIHNNTHSYVLYTSWNILAPLVSSTCEFWLQRHLLLDFLWHYATKNKRQLLLLKPAALPPLCLSLTQ